MRRIYERRLEQLLWTIYNEDIELDITDSYASAIVKLLLKLKE